MSLPPAVVFENERLLAVDKPAGQAVIPGRGLDRPCLVEAMAAALGRRPYVVHRIDRDASGLVLFAKDAAAHRWLCLEFEMRRVSKTYLVAVLGEVAGDGQVDLSLREFGSGRVAAAPDGKPCLTRYRVARRLRGAALLEVEPVTGRRHQIRAHLYGLGHPVLGDRLYGRPRPVGGAPRLMLHSHSLRIAGPDGGRLDLRAEPPADFQRVLAGLEP